MKKIKSVLSRYKFLYLALKSVWHFSKWLFIEIIFENLFFIFPINNRKIVACSFYGSQYGDNPKAIIEELLKKEKEEKKEKLDIVWVLNKKRVKTRRLPDGIRSVEYGSLRYFYELATAKIWIDNSRKMLVPKKKKNQFYIQTWHGSIGVKMVEKDAHLSREYKRNAKRDSKNADLFLSGSKFISKLYRNSFWYDGEILEAGSPRLDAVIVNYDNERYISNLKKKVCNSVGVKNSVKIILYAPTFRENNDESYNLDYEGLLDTVKKKYGGEWRIFSRFHPNIADKMNNLELPKDVLNVTAYPDLYELLLICDIVVSDYSSVSFEAAMIKKAVFIYAPDYDEYKKHERGFYYDYKKDLPFPFAETNSELSRDIMNYSERKKQEVNEGIDRLLGIVETGKSAKIVSDKIMELVS